MPNCGHEDLPSDKLTIPYSSEPTPDNLFNTVDPDWTTHPSMCSRDIPSSPSEFLPGGHRQPNASLNRTFQTNPKAAAHSRSYPPPKRGPPSLSAGYSSSRRTVSPSSASASSPSPRYSRSSSLMRSCRVLRAAAALVYLSCEKWRFYCEYIFWDFLEILL
jgi:hypothetical protein